jgi:hypothetical protein
MLLAAIPTGAGPSTASRSDACWECQPASVIACSVGKTSATRSTRGSSRASWMPPSENTQEKLVGGSGTTSRRNRVTSLVLPTKEVDIVSLTCADA